MTHPARPSKSGHRRRQKELKALVFDRRRSLPVSSAETSSDATISEPNSSRLLNGSTAAVYHQAFEGRRASGQKVRHMEEGMEEGTPGREEGPVRTALYEAHLDSGGHIVDFHGFELPIRYTTTIEEHLKCRSHAGLFDVSHMGFFRFSGSGLMEWFDGIATQRASNVAAGRCAYTHFLDESGIIIDDMIFAVTSASEIAATGCSGGVVSTLPSTKSTQRTAKNDGNNLDNVTTIPIDTNADELAGEGDSQPYILGVPNASMVPTMWSWFEQNLPDDDSVIIEDLSDSTSILALQGPNAMQIVGDVLGLDNKVGRFRCQAIRENPLGITGWIQGTGYTGESGVEIFVSNEEVRRLWDVILAHSDSGVVPIGLGARDTLRMEMGYLLSGQDFIWPGLSADDENINIDLSTIADGQTLARDTAETFVPFGLDIDHEFIGRSRVQASRTAQANGTAARWLGIRYLEKGPFPRPGHTVLKLDDQIILRPDGDDASEVKAESETIIGYITSGGPAPSLERVGIGLAYLRDIEIGDEVLIAPNPRKRVRAVVVRPPFI